MSWLASMTSPWHPWSRVLTNLVATPRSVQTPEPRGSVLDDEAHGLHWHREIWQRVEDQVPYPERRPGLEKRERFFQSPPPGGKILDCPPARIDRKIESPAHFSITDAPNISRLQQLMRQVRRSSAWQLPGASGQHPA